jgi:hypothetical protein
VGASSSLLSHREKFQFPARGKWGRKKRKILSSVRQLWRAGFPARGAENTSSGEKKKIKLKGGSPIILFTSSVNKRVE